MIIKTRKRIAAGFFSSVPLTEANAVMPPPATAKEYARKVCAPDKHRWVLRKFTRYCKVCGAEDTR